MHLTINEIVYLIKIWNSWYLLEHDSNLNSHHSENGMDISISPIETTAISPETIEDLKSYTENINLEETDKFKIDFLFMAADHQPEEIFDALKPVINKALDSEVNIVNFMDFIETNLPPEENLDKDSSKLLTEYREKSAEETEDKDEQETEIIFEDNNEEQEVATQDVNEKNKVEELEKLHNELKIKGIIRREYIEVTEILHNDRPFPDLNLFLEASRLYETIERNTEEQFEENKENTFQCSSPEEARMVEVYLATTTDLPPKIVDSSLIETLASPEDLATVVTYVRYNGTFKLFNNPYLGRLRHKRKEQAQAMRKMVMRSCSCFMYIILFAIMLFIWWLLFRNQ
jgi:hypothetical protein